MTGQNIMLVLIICFVAIPVWQAHRWHVAGRTEMTWADVRWLLAYFIIGFAVLAKLRPILILGVH